MRPERLDKLAETMHKAMLEAENEWMERTTVETWTELPEELKQIYRLATIKFMKQV